MSLSGSFKSHHSGTVCNMSLFCRSHVEFQLNELPHYPFWFTPAQLAGRLVVNTSSSQVLHFELALPTDRQLNVGKLISMIP